MADPQGFVTFAPLEVLASADLNGYLAQQVCGIYASSADRSSSIGAKLREGMLSYLQDTNEVERYDGAAWVALTNPTTLAAAIATAKTFVPKVSGGVGSGTTNGSGDITVLHGLAWTPTAVVVLPVDNGGVGLGLLTALVQNLDAAGFTIRWRSTTTGAVLASAGIVFHYMLFGGYGV